MNVHFTHHRIVDFATDGSIHFVVDAPRDGRKGLWNKREAKKYVKTSPGVARVVCEKHTRL